MEENGVTFARRIPDYGLRLQVTGMQGYYTLKSQAEQHVVDNSMPAPMDYAQKAVPDLEQRGYRAKPGTSISVKLDPGRDVYKRQILIQTTSENAANGRLILCRDSFGNALHPFLAADFREAVITRQMPYPLEQVQAGDTVIVEIVERNLANILKYPPELGNLSAADSVE